MIAYGCRNAECEGGSDADYKNKNAGREPHDEKSNQGIGNGYGNEARIGLGLR